MFAVPYRKDPSPTFYQRGGYWLVPVFLWTMLLAVPAIRRFGGRGK
jgi:hypothetical protein